jgi:hypothetical protein
MSLSNALDHVLRGLLRPDRRRLCSS